MCYLFYIKKLNFLCYNRVVRKIETHNIGMQGNLRLSKLLQSTQSELFHLFFLKILDM